MYNPPFETIKTNDILNCSFFRSICIHIPFFETVTPIDNFFKGEIVLFTGELTILKIFFLKKQGIIEKSKVKGIPIVIDAVSIQFH